MRYFNDIKMRIILFLLITGFTFSCSEVPDNKISTPKPNKKNTQNNDKKEPQLRKYTFKAAVGPSMGGGVASRLGLKFHQKWDFI